MTPMTVRGVPRGLQRDAWWMAPDAQTGIGSGTVVPKTYRLPILIALVVVADFLVMRSDDGLGFVALILTLATAVHWTLRGSPRLRHGRFWRLRLCLPLICFNSLRL